MANYLQLKWTVSRARDTYGYNIVTLTDSDTGKKYRATGGGYDMTGTVFSEWLQDVYQDELRAIADQAHETYEADSTTTRNESGYYGMRAIKRVKPNETIRVTLDGGCGLESMRRIAEAIGLKVRATIDRKGNATGFVLPGPRGRVPYQLHPDGG
jgi:hypothetical protein